MQKVPLVGLEDVAREALRRVQGFTRGERATIIALSGDLGAGKTTFTQALARALGVSEVVQSPTYILMKSYALAHSEHNRRFTTLVHIDAYRLESPEAFAALGPEAFLNDPNALVVVEWPERIEGALPAPDLVLRFSSKDTSERERYIAGIDVDSKK